MSQLPQKPLLKQSGPQAAFRAVGALVLREMTTRYGRTPGGYAWAILDPLGMIILLSYAFSLLANAPTLGTSFLLFKATGFLILQMFTVLGGQIGHSLGFSRPLLHYPRVTWGDAILARFLLNSLVVTVVIVLILTGIILYEQIDLLLRWEQAIGAVILAALLGFGVGSLNCYLFMRFEVWQQIWSILTRPLFLISGVIVLYEDMPPLAQQVLWYNPILHLTGMMRAAFYPMYRPDYVSLQFVCITILVPMVLGLLLLHRYHRELLNR